MSEFTFSLQAVWVAKNNGDGTFGTPVLGQSSKDLNVAQKLVSDRAQGNGNITSLAAQIISYDITWDTASFDTPVMTVLWNQAAASSAHGSHLTVGNQVLMQYFGLIAQTFPDSGDVLLFWPRCKVTGDVTWKNE